jgi:hypothetical protein
VTNADDATVPAVANGFWYLVRASSCGGTGSFNTTSPRQVGSRDTELASAAGACP